MEQKAHTHFSQSEGNDQSGKVENKVFEAFGFLLDFHIIEGREVRSKIIIREVCFEVSQLFSVDEFEGLSPNVVKCNRLYIQVFILIFETKDPHFSDVNEVIITTVRILLLHFHTFGVIVEGKADLAD